MPRGVAAVSERVVGGKRRQADKKGSSREQQEQAAEGAETGRAGQAGTDTENRQGRGEEAATQHRAVGRAEEVGRRGKC